MLDLETLGTRPDAAIIQVGAVLFEPVSGGKLLNHVGFNHHVLIQDGSGSIDHGTVCFWLAEKSAKAMGEALGSKAQPLAQVLQEFVDWPQQAHGLGWDAIGGVWAKPSNFDLPILQSAFARFGMPAPWDHRATRCARTLFSITGTPEIDWTGFVNHDALDDATGQAMQVQKAMGLLQR
ncbi:3'-5' exoribonuclease [Brucella abortus]|uniref:3'-5' exonuclease n=1 Tax=Brucella abortus TaxID=235 RepID=UPI0004E89B4E|nr:3'-5' exonuclease [Brucella abortus]KFH18470.1 hypothetical protein IB60_17385 [Brucella abortus LMN1]RUQ67370.1 3'-5' exoribonuclease [Brucella abortus]RUQ78575.1 3'-5' exoribonuclease [Brucella abortus]RUQ88317.1 3'-5' exoribonuclease [Brucella abortus]RUQ90273.1 3'-5' exoribonuclease [Brucella abortus]